jgi:hypothetical protein
MKRKLLAFLLLCLFAITSVMAQNKTITGKVVGADDGLPLPGVSVRAGSVGTTTGSDGNYSLSVPQGTKTLTFTYIGYVTQNVSVGTTGTINVRLVSDSQMIAEVVVTGYGVAQKRDLGSSSALVTGKQFENLPIQSFDRALQGRAAGVQVTAQSGQPGGAINVRVRGVGSINAGNDPYTLAARTASQNAEGLSDIGGTEIGAPVDNLFPFLTGNPFEASPWDFWDSTTTVNTAIALGLPASQGTQAHVSGKQQNPDMSMAKSMAYKNLLKTHRSFVSQHS